MRKQLSGTAAARGYALGRARMRLPHRLDIEATEIAASDIDAEIARFHAAVDTVRTEMRSLRDRLQGALGVRFIGQLNLKALLGLSRARP